MAAASPSSSLVILSSLFGRRVGGGADWLRLFSPPTSTRPLPSNISSSIIIRASSSSFNISFAGVKAGGAKTQTNNNEGKGKGTVIPWIVEDTEGNLSLQTTRPVDLLDYPSSPSPSSSSSPLSPKVSRPKQQQAPTPPKYSKAARRFYNEAFRKPERLSKVLAKAGVASRRGSEEVIFEGRVAVNGAICKTPQTLVDPLKDAIYIDGNSLPKKLPPKLYFALNKPKGYICSSGEDNSKSVVSLLDEYLKIWIKRNTGVRKPRLFTVGRLDVATSGLIFVTNDGEFAQKVAHPSSGLTKEYVAAIEGKVTKRHLQVISEGTLVEGVHCTPVAVELISAQANERKQRLRIVVCEGRNHEVRHLIKNAGLKLHSLKRVRIGDFKLPQDLSIGKHQVLGEAQIKRLVGLKM